MGWSWNSWIDGIPLSWRSRSTRFQYSASRSRALAISLGLTFGSTSATTWVLLRWLSTLPIHLLGVLTIEADHLTISGIPPRGEFMMVSRSVADQPSTGCRWNHNRTLFLSGRS